MNKKIYDIDFERLAKLLLPIKLRKSRFFSYIMSLLSPLISLYDIFISWKKNKIYQLDHTGQVIYLEKVLNELVETEGYDPNDHENTRLIYITDGESPDRVYISRRDENNPLFVGTVYIGRRDEYEAFYSDFIVNVPSTITFDEDRMKAVIDYYKLANKYYKIRYE